MPRVAVLGTGGTISFVARSPLDFFEYADFTTPQDATAVVAAVPELRAIADVIAVPFRALPSTAVGPRDWLELRRAIHELVARERDLAGVVVTHGTATLEETAYFLDLTLKVDI